LRTSVGFTVHAVPTTEVRKADGSLTCQSIVLGCT
jgi:N-dimethylarginine dimethylaminohydrolase